MIVKSKVGRTLRRERGQIEHLLSKCLKSFKKIDFFSDNKNERKRSIIIKVGRKNRTIMQLTDATRCTDAHRQLPSDILYLRICKYEHISDSTRKLTPGTEMFEKNNIKFSTRSLKAVQNTRAITCITCVYSGASTA